MASSEKRNQVYLSRQDLRLLLAGYVVGIGEADGESIEVLLSDIGIPAIQDELRRAEQGPGEQWAERRRGGAKGMGRWSSARESQPAAGKPCA